MKIKRVLSMTVSGLMTHAFRAFLAALGVVLGVGAVVSMLAISEGARKESLDQITAMGIENIVLQSVKPPPGAESTSEQSSYLESYGITSVDADHILATFENVKMVVPVRNMLRQVRARGKLTDIHVMATAPEFLSITRSRLQDNRSRFITEFDCRETKAVCVIGSQAARTLIGFEDPIGHHVTVGGISFQIVGILHNDHGSKLSGVHDLNHLIYVPYEAGNALFGKAIMDPARRWQLSKVEMDNVYITVKDVGQLRNTVSRLRAYLGATHDTLDYRLLVPFELMKQKEATQRIFSIVMASIAAISLLVGGIGIMNIMLANIYERTREIGTRRAVGAKKKDILYQFLAESVFLTAMGGAIGVAVGIGIAQMVESYAGMRTDVTMLSVVVSLVVSVLTGVTFGTYPAWKAANLDPIVALRHE